VTAATWLTWRIVSTATPHRIPITLKSKSKGQKAMTGKHFFCYGRLKMSGEVIAIRRDEKGYHKTDYGIQSQETVDAMNQAMGIDMVTADAAGLCSLSGNWDAFESIEKKLRYCKRK